MIKKANKKGLTIIELIITIALVSVIMVFLFKMLSNITYEKENEFINMTDQATRAEIIETIEDNLIEYVSTKESKIEQVTYSPNKNEIQLVNDSGKVVFKIVQSGDKNNNQKYKSLALYKVESETKLIQKWDFKTGYMPQFVESGSDQTCKVVKDGNFSIIQCNIPVYTENSSNKKNGEVNSNNTLDDIYFTISSQNENVEINYNEEMQYIQDHIHDYVYISEAKVLNGSGNVAGSPTYTDNTLSTSTQGLACSQYITYQIKVVNTTNYNAYIVDAKNVLMQKYAGANTNGFSVKFYNEEGVELNTDEDFVPPKSSKYINVEIKNNCSDGNNVITTENFIFSLYKYHDFTIKSNPTGTNVEITTTDGTFTGTAPFTVKVLENSNLSYKVSYPGYEDKTGTYTMGIVDAQQMVTLNQVSYELTVKSNLSDAGITIVDTVTNETITGSGSGTIITALKDRVYRVTVTRTGYQTKTVDIKMGNAAKTETIELSPQQYTITFNANGGSVSSTSKTVNYGQQIGTLPTATKPGAIFIGWFEAKGSSRNGSLLYKDHPLLYYSDAYGDLYNAFQYNEHNLYTHYLTWGKGEGRRLSQYLSTDTYTNTSGVTLYAGYVYSWNQYTLKKDYKTKLYATGKKSNLAIGTWINYTYDLASILNMDDKQLHWTTGIAGSVINPYPEGAYFAANSDSIRSHHVKESDTTDKYCVITKKVVTLVATVTVNIYQIYDVTWAKGDLVGTVYSCNQNEYPSDNISGNNWYVSK